MTGSYLFITKASWAEKRNITASILQVFAVSANHTQTLYWMLLWWGHSIKLRHLEEWSGEATTKAILNSQEEGQCDDFIPFLVWLICGYCCMAERMG